jgi:hypothetical protein
LGEGAARRRNEAQIKVDERDAYVLLEEAAWEKEAGSWSYSNPSVAEFEAKAKG